MRTEQIMRRGEDCPVVTSEATLGDCYEAILNAPRRAGAAAVVDDAGLLVGIITHGDFFRLFKNHDHAVNQPVSEVMTRDPKRIGDRERVMEAISVMKRHSIDELPVVDETNRLVGLIDVQDLISRGYAVMEGA